MKDTVIDIEVVKTKTEECSTILTNISDEISTISSNVSLLSSIWKGIDSDKSIDTITSSMDSYSDILTSLLDYNSHLELIAELYEEKDNIEF